MVASWLPSNHELICYIDNNKDKQGTDVQDIPVVSLEEALAEAPDRIWIATLNTEAAASIEKQIRDAGYEGVLRYAHAFRDAQDIRIAALRLIAPEITSRDLPGAVAELGVFRGEFAAELSRQFPDRDLYLFDTFEGFPEADLEKENEVNGGRAAWHPDFTDTSIEYVSSQLAHPEKARFVQGYFPESAAQLKGDERYALVNIDPDLYEPTLQGLRYFWPRMVRNGIIMVHDYNSLQFPRVKKAVQEFVRETDAMIVPLPDLHGTAVIVRC